MSVRPGLWNMLSKPPEVRGGALSVFPGRVERVDGVRCGESPALAGSLLYPHYLTEGKRKRTRTRREGWQTVEALPRCCLSIGGDVLRCGGDSIAQKRTRWPPVPSVMVRRGEV